MSGIAVEFGKWFDEHWQNFPKSDQEKIKRFIYHVQTVGLTNLEGVNKSSDDVDTNDPNFRQKVQYAIQHHLWHYHIGIPDYDERKPFGQRTSEYVLHYQYFDNRIVLVDFSAHPPFELPSMDYLQS